MSFFLSIILITSLKLQFINSIDKVGILDIKSNPLGITSKQDLIPVKLGISEKYPNTRIMAYADINKDKM